MLFIWLFLPLLCSILIWIFPFLISKKNSFLIIAHLYLILFILWFFFFWSICFNQYSFFLELCPWINCGSLNNYWGFQLDGLVVIMLGLVSFVSTAVHFFSLNYMANDSNLIRFFSLLSLFTFFMFVLVASDNFIVLFLGWEGIGICSFLLISFWHTRISATKAALKAIILNRIGDSAFIAATAFIFLIFKSCDFSVVFSLIPFIVNEYFLLLGWSISYIEIISFLFVIGSVGKSAQLGLHGWLPEAMEGPTPVSALIHAATLVTAGVFLIIRCSPFFEYAPFTLNFILILGGLTCIFGSTVACAQNDIKRIIAFSTTSQLGYMFFARGLSSYNISLFHLLNHGFFKALLFLCAGAIIHLISHEQDIRKLGGLIIFTPYIYSAFLISLLALIGFPFLSGFYSKEVIIELAYSSYNINGFFIYWISTLSAFLTSFYGTRCLYLTFVVKNNSFKFFIQNIGELGYSIIFATTILIVGSIFSGLWFKDILIGFGSNFFGTAIYISNYHLMLDYEYLSWYVKSLPLIGTFLGVLLALCLNKFFLWYFKTSNYNNTFIIHFNDDLGSFFLNFFVSLKTFLNYKWFIDFLLNYYCGIFILKHSYETFYKIFDKGICEIVLINGFSFFLIKNSRLIIIKQNGFVYTVFCLILLSLIFLFEISFLL